MDEGLNFGGLGLHGWEAVRMRVQCAFDGIGKWDNRVSVRTSCFAAYNLSCIDTLHRASCSPACPNTGLIASRRRPLFARSPELNFGLESMHAACQHISPAAYWTRSSSAT